MTIKDDVLALKLIEEDLKTIHGRYIGTKFTPLTVPTIGSINNFTELGKQDGESITVKFTPTEKDYQWKVDVGSPVLMRIYARRNLGDDITETITTADIQ